MTPLGISPRKSRFPKSITGSRPAVAEDDRKNR
jgi:hypothetical protein